MNSIYLILVHGYHLFRPALGLRTVSGSKMHDLEISVFELAQFGLDQLILLDTVILRWSHLLRDISNSSGTVIVRDYWERVVNIFLLEFFALNLVDLFHQDLLEACFRIKFRLQFHDISCPCARYTDISIVIHRTFRDFLQSGL